MEDLLKGAHDALDRMRRAFQRGTGCRLTPERPVPTRRTSPMTETDKSLPDDCRFAAKCLACKDEFETGQMLLILAAARIEALEAQLAEAERRAAIREEHAEWSQASFGDVSAIGPAKHLSKEALEVAADPRDIMEHVDCQFLLWDMQRRAGFSDAEITDAMTQKLPILKSRKYPPPKEGEPREHDRSIRALPLTQGGE